MMPSASRSSTLSAAESVRSGAVSTATFITRLRPSRILGVVASGLSKEILERRKFNTVFPVVPTHEDALRTLMLD